ncbi:TonB-dependent receptor plug domain-containing protein [candidate division KSB1 bacterium]|nr:TonB-dependent receptor plug domain-containing protein [candidate division KSB1 bacterium]
MNARKFIIIVYLLIFQSVAFNMHAQEKEKRQALYEMSIEELMDVTIVTAGKKTEEVRDIPASIVLITREDIEKYGYTTLTEILESIPGIFPVNDYSYYGVKFGIRGFWNTIANNDIKILVNGVDQINDIFSNYPLTKIAVPVEVIDRIEVVRGPMSVIYGSGAFFAVINIFTNAAQDKKSMRLATLSAGTQEGRRAVFRSAEKKTDFEYVVNISYSSSDGIDQPYSKMTNNIASLPVATQGTGGLLGNQEKYADFYGSFGRFYSYHRFAETKYGFCLVFPSYKHGSVAHISTTNSMIGYKTSFSKALILDLRLGFNKFNEDNDHDFLFDNAYIYETTKSSSYYFNLDALYNVSTNLEFALGLNYYSASDVQESYHMPSLAWNAYYNTDMQLDDGEAITTRALFGHLNYKPFHSLKIVLGLRLEQLLGYMLKQKIGDHAIGIPADVNKGIYSNQNVEIIPRIAAIYYFNETNVFKIMYGQATKHPSWWQNSSELFYGRPLSLNSEKVHTIEMNYISNPITEITINSSVYYNILNNLIIRKFGLDQNGVLYNYFSNAGEITTLGAELTVKYMLFQRATIEICSAWQDTENKNHPHIKEGYSPEYLGYFKASYDVKKNFSAALATNYVGAMEADWRQNPDGSGMRIGDSVDDYFSASANLRLNNLLDKGVYINIHCANLLDTDIRYPATTNINDTFPKGTLGMGRSILVSVGRQY